MMSGWGAGLSPSRTRLGALPVHEYLRSTASGLRLGGDYTDVGGRRHKPYAWGDVYVLAERPATRGAELVRRSALVMVPNRPPNTGAGDDLDVSIREDVFAGLLF